MAALHRRLSSLSAPLMLLACQGPPGEPSSSTAGNETAPREARGAHSKATGKKSAKQTDAVSRGLSNKSAKKTNAERRGVPGDPSATPTPSPAQPSPAPERAEGIYALDLRVFIRARPSQAAAEVGALRLGQGVRTTGPAKPTHDCPAPGGFYPVAPEGHVCLDRTTTTDSSHPLVVAKQHFHVDFTRDLGGSAAKDAPLRFGESIETPIYSRVPTEPEQARSEYELARHLAAVRAVREAQAQGEPPPPRALWRLRGASAAPASGEPPSFLQASQDSPWHVALGQPGRARLGIVPPRSSISFIHEFTAGGRSFLMTPELTVVPKDKVRELRPSGFQGVRLNGSQRLPLAFFRSDETRAWRLSTAASRTTLTTLTATPSATPDKPRDAVKAAGSPQAPSGLKRTAEVHAAATQADDEVSDADVNAGGAQESPFSDDPQDAARLTPDAHRFERLGSVGLTGRARWQRGRRYLETTEDSLWVAQDEVGVVTQQRLRGVTLAPKERWIDVSIFQGTLTAYEGERPVFTTLISPGASGYKPRRGPDRKNTTPTGTFRIEWKHLSTTMSPDPERRRYYLTDVPFTQFFHMPFALHAAYWHDRFGEPMSGGCVNLSVRDARWLFDFTSPSLPEGWHSVRSGGPRGEGTWVSIR